MSDSILAITVFTASCHPSQPAPTSLFGSIWFPIINFFSGTSKAVLCFLHVYSTCRNLRTL